jgi:hypothetical protein
MYAVIDAVARAAGTTASDIRSTRGGALRQLSAWIGWNEGWQTLTAIAASLRLRSAGHVSNLIRSCEEAFSSDAAPNDPAEMRSFDTKSPAKI